MYKRQPGDFEHYPVDAKGAMRWLEQDGGNVSVTAVGDLAFLDVDVDKSVDASIRETLLVRIRMALDAMDAFYHRSPRGGMHLLIRNATRKIKERTGLIEFPHGQIDVKGFGKGYVIGPGSRTMDGVYTGHVGGVLPTVDDDAFARLLLSIDGKAKSTVPVVVGRRPQYINYDSVDLSELKDYLNHISPDVGMTDWLTVIYGTRERYGNNGLATAARSALVEWSSRGSKYKGGETERVWDKRHGSGRQATFASVIRLAKLGGAKIKSRPIEKVPSGDWSGGDWVYKVDLP